MTENGRSEKILSAAQYRAATQLAATGDPKAAAEAAGVSVRTLRRWRGQPDFATALREAEAEAIRVVSRRLGAIADEALDVLHEVMGDAQASAGQRIRAAGIVLDTALKWRQHADLEARVEALETKTTRSKAQ